MFGTNKKCIFFRIIIVEQIRVYIREKSAQSLLTIYYFPYWFQSRNVASLLSKNDDRHR